MRRLTSYRFNEVTCEVTAPRLTSFAWQQSNQFSPALSRSLLLRSRSCVGWQQQHHEQQQQRHRGRHITIVTGGCSDRIRSVDSRWDNDMGFSTNAWNVMSRTPKAVDSWCAAIIHKVTMMPFVITLYGQCFRLHVLGQQVVSDNSVIRRCWSVCRLCSEPNNAKLLLHLLIDVFGTSILLQISNIACTTTWRRVLDDHGYKI